MKDEAEGLAVGTWVRARSCTTPGAPTFLGCVVAVREEPRRYVIMNLRGGMVAEPGEVLGPVTEVEGCELPTAEVLALAGRLARGI